MDEQENSTIHKLSGQFTRKVTDLYLPFLIGSLLLPPHVSNFHKSKELIGILIAFDDASLRSS